MPRNIDRRALFGVLLALTAGVAGCQRGPTWDLASVEGTVTKDGQPLRDIEVTFFPDLNAGVQGPRSTAVTDEAGHYRLRTHNGDEGAIVGKQRVVLRDLETSKGRRRDPAREPQPSEKAQRPEEQPKTASKSPRVPPSYGRFDKTPLRAGVHSGSQVIDLEVK